MVRQTQQKVSPLIEPGGVGCSGWGSSSAVEVKSSTRRIEGTHLRLEMVHLGVVPLDAATQPVLATRPAQVSPRHVAAIAKNERVGRLRIAKIQSLGKHETREAVINAWITRGSHIVRAGNLQVIQSLWRSEVKGRTQPQ